MKIKLLAAIGAMMLTVGLNDVYAQRGGGERPDPKMMSARVAERLEFTTDQKAELATLNEKFSSPDYDKRKYREEFDEILTNEQKEKMDEMRQNRDGAGRERGRRSARE